MDCLKVIALLLLAMAASAAVTITDTLYLPDGSYASGSIQVTLVTGTASNSRTLAGFAKRYPVGPSGAVRLTLEANTSLNPAGTYYRVDYFLRDGTTKVEYWNVPTGGPYAIREVRWQPRAPTGYQASFSGSTWTVPAAIHGIHTTALQATCYDNSEPANEIECAVSVHPTTHTVTASFASTQTGKLLISAVSAWNTQAFVKAFTSSTSVSVPYSEHLTPGGRYTVQCWSSATPAVTVECEPSVNATTNDITVTFASSQSGYVVVSGR